MKLCVKINWDAFSNLLCCSIHFGISQMKIFKREQLKYFLLQCSGHLGFSSFSFCRKISYFKILKESSIVTSVCNLILFLMRSLIRFQVGKACDLWVVTRDERSQKATHALNKIQERSFLLMFKRGHCKITMY